MNEELDLEITQDEQDDGFADVERLFIKRDENGDVVPVEEKAMPFGKVLVRPIVYGRIERIMANGGLERLEASTVAELLADHYVKPDLSGLTAKRLQEDMPAMAPQVLLVALFKASGVTGDIEVTVDGEAELQLEGN